MRTRDTLRISLDSLRRNKSRSVLTMLGIIIGVASVILMLSIGNAAERFILSQVASFGSNTVFIVNGPGEEKTSGPQSVLLAKQVLTIRDLKRLKQLPWVTLVDGAIIQPALIESSTEAFQTSVFSGTEQLFEFYNLEIGQGSFFTSSDVDGVTSVAVIGTDLASDLFGNEDPVGQRIKIAKKSYRIVGLLAPAGTKFFTNMDRVVFVPVTTLMQQLNRDKLLRITVQVEGIAMSDAKEQIRVALRETHKLNNPEGDLSKDDFQLTTQDDAAERAGAIGDILQILLTSIAAISLVVGGVGIMNIMYVTVTERTREIGLRKAIGAKPRDVLAQFLMEAVVLTVLAGAVGVVLGVTFSWLGLTALGSYQEGWTFTMPWNAMALGFTVSAAIGIVFGYFPARGAARLNPIEALRYE
ncbi:ABC transporter permease [Patescibacteria group bacterium]|nr:ABC transporter permease [Patescibacteria group bacterium]MBU1448628.1 ABC transporter permease [Patescibacteria group bacterium]MBU2613413.1 ABC transporter permease [Patescibacteria group bacterium]